MQADAQPKPIAPKAKRRWLQFGLRTLLGLTAVAAVGMGLWVNSAERQRRAVAFVRNLGGRVVYDGDPGPNRPAPERAWYRKLLGEDYFSSVHLVSLGGTRVRDADLVQLKGLTRLTRLDLYDTKVTDAGLEHLEGLTRLTWLDLYGAKVTGAGLQHLEGLTRLSYLNLFDTKVNDAGLEHLEGLPRLDWLDLGNTQASDAGIVHLKRLTRLKTLGLDFTQVSDEGIAELREAIPNCQVERRQR